MQFLIGNDGRRWLPFGREFTGYFGFSGTWEETLDHAVRSLGQVSLHISPRRCRVRLRPEALTWGAFQQLISVLLDDERKPVVLEIVGAAASPTELYVRPDDAIARIDDLRAMNRRTGGPQWRASFIDEPLSLHRLKLDSAPGLRAAHRDWIRRRGRPVSETWPRHLAIYGEEQARKLIGRPFDEHPLHAYTMRATKGYRDTDRAQAPRLDLIEAVVRPEDSPTVRLRYERLLLPWRGEDGTRFVASLSHSIWRRASACPVC